MLDVTLVPMLQVQRSLYDLPRGPGRFRSYLKAMTGGTGDLLLPLTVFNPMGRDKVADRLDELIDLGAESLAREAIEEARSRLGGFEETFRLGLVLADDEGGGWTNRTHVEIKNRFRPYALLKRGWAVSLCWTSEFSSANDIGRAVLATIYRTIAHQRSGEPRTLGAMMIREGFASLFSGEMASGLNDEAVESTRQVVEPHRGATDLTTILPCLFGDRAAQAFGNDAFGLDENAGLSLALVEAIETSVSPEKAL